MLKLEGLVQEYSHRRILNGITLEASTGEFLSILGPSGCGKTTLLRVICGLAQAQEGRIFWQGQEISSLAPHERGFGLVFQQHALMPHLTVEENVAFPLVAQRFSAEKFWLKKIRYFFGSLMKLLDEGQHDRVQKVLERVRLDGFSRRRVEGLSGGEAQRVALARSLVLEPKLLLMDEPLSSVDRQLKIELRNLIRKIHADFGLTVIYVTHDQEEALALSDRIALMHQGSIIQAAPAREILKNPANDWVREFFNVDDLATPQLRRLIQEVF